MIRLVDGPPADEMTEEQATAREKTYKKSMRNAEKFILEQNPGDTIMFQAPNDIANILLLNGMKRLHLSDEMAKEKPPCRVS